MPLTGELQLGVSRPSTPGGNGQVLFNNNGIEGSSPALTFNVAANTLVVGANSPNVAVNTSALTAAVGRSILLMQGANTSNDAYIVFQNSAGWVGGYIYGANSELRLYGNTIINFDVGNIQSLTQAMSIDANGVVGIGNNNPSALGFGNHLVVQNLAARMVLVCTGNANNSGYRWQVQNTAGSVQSLGVYAVPSDTGKNQIIGLSADDSNYQLQVAANATIYTSANLLVGAIQGANNWALFNSENGTQILLQSIGADYGAIGNPLPQVWVLGATSTQSNAQPTVNVLSWTATGNVGVGTIAPTANLHVVGNVLVNAASFVTFNVLTTTLQGAGDTRLLVQSNTTANLSYIEYAQGGSVGGYTGVEGVAGSLGTGSQPADLVLRSFSGNVLIVPSSTANTEISSNTLVSKDIRTLGQVRATGWYNTPTGTDYGGLACEMGVSGGGAYILSYDRTTAAYGTFEIDANTIVLFPENSGFVGVNQRSPQVMLDVLGFARANSHQDRYNNVGTQALASANLNIDCRQGTYQDILLANNCNIFFQNCATTGNVSVLTLTIRQSANGGNTVTWENVIRWSDNIIPTLSTSANRADRFTFDTYNGGTFWYGSLIMANIAGSNTF